VTVPTATVCRILPTEASAEWFILGHRTREVTPQSTIRWPQLSLTGNFGLRNTDTRYLFDWASKFYSAGPGISVPIFKGGALIANVRLSRTEAAVAALNYQQES